MSDRLVRAAFGFVLLMTGASAFAHVGQAGHADSLMAGVAHPFLGLDHVLAMVAVGLWALFLGGRAVWAVPAAFVAAMAGGFALAASGIALPHVESGIAASVLVLGLLVATHARLRLAASLSLVAVFAVFHGHAHGSPLAWPGLMFGAGLAAATVVLHAIGLGLGHVLAGRLTLARTLGSAMAAVGLVLLGAAA